MERGERFPTASSTSGSEAMSAAATVGSPAASIPTTPPAPGLSLPGLHANRLGVAGIAFFVIAAVAPMAAIVGASPIVFASNGASAPATYLLAGILFAVFSVGYVTMSRHISNAGGFVAYVAQGLGARAATAAAGITLLFYTALLCALWAFYGVIAQGTFDAKFGIDISPTVLTFATLAIVTLITFRGVDVSMRLAALLLCLEAIALLILDVAILGGGGASGISVEGFAPSAIVGPGLGLAFLFAVACFTGFEATVVFSEEARDPHRTIPRAAYVAIAFVAVFYALTTWALSNGWGTGNVQQAAIEDPVGFVFAQSTEHAGSWLTSIIEVLVVTSFIAMFVGFQSMFARYVFALGRAGVLPRRMSVADERTGSPKYAALAIGIVVGFIVAAFLVFGADPVTTIYSWLLALGTVSLIAVLILTCVAIIAFFARTKADHRPWHTRIAPALALAGFVTVAYLAIDNYTTLLGGQGGVARWLLLLIPVVAVAGWIFATVRRNHGKTIDYAADLR